MASSGFSTTAADAERLLVVSVMLTNQNDPRGEHFREGVMTKCGTIQKYFTQAEIYAFRSPGAG
jgi:hypothetical protein